MTENKTVVIDIDTTETEQKLERLKVLLTEVKELLNDISVNKTQDVRVVNITKEDLYKGYTK